MAAYPAPSSFVFSKKEYWSGLTFPFQYMKLKKWKWSRSVLLTLWEHMDSSLSGGSVHGIFQARVLEWVAIAFPYHWWEQYNRNMENDDIDNCVL